MVASFACAQSQVSPSEAEPSVTQEELHRAAVAYANITEIRKDLQQQIAKTADQDEKYSLKEEANRRMIEAVKEQGLSAGQYTEILKQMQSDKNLYDRFMQMVSQRINN
jgi:ABC-type microcin C transport system permease subunit YejB